MSCSNIRPPVNGPNGGLAADTVRQVLGDRRMTAKPFNRQTRAAHDMPAAIPADNNELHGFSC
jgi:hypothetical protein